MNEIVVALTVAGVNALGLILVAVVGSSARSHAKAAGEDARAARVQVENTHSTNLRDDLDEVARKVDWLIDVYQSEFPRRRRLFWSAPASPPNRKVRPHA